MKKQNKKVETKTKEDKCDCGDKCTGACASNQGGCGCGNGGCC
ncbi:MAG TPA: hypothetical protein VJB94_05055 [Candidatus Nanoarchaeia archaeon]|nr:hypothetical protein [Candidatus Nanoarchaeia archaeon]